MAFLYGAGLTLLARPLFLPARPGDAVGLGHGADAPCQLGGQGCAVHPPAPVFAQGGGVVDPGAVVQAQIVLQGDDAPPPHRGHRGADKVPVEGLDGAGVPVEVPADRRPLFGQDAAVPARHRLVVVGAGVDHAVCGVVVGQIVPCTGGIPGVEGELQHLHAGETAVRHQLADAVGEVAQVLGDDRPPAQSRLQGVEQLFARALLPGAAAWRRAPPAGTR